MVGAPSTERLQAAGSALETPATFENDSQDCYGRPLLHCLRRLAVLRSGHRPRAQQHDDDRGQGRDQQLAQDGGVSRPPVMACSRPAT